MNTLQHLTFTLGLIAELALLSWCPGVQGGEGVSSIATNLENKGNNNIRKKRAPGWGKREDDMDNFDRESSPDLLGTTGEETEEEKRAPGWGKRDLAMDKRAPGWGKRAPGWGKRAPGWGKRAPGWGKRAPGWGKRAPGWGKRSDFFSEPEDKRAPGWGKRAPGWGKRAPGWGKRAPGWGKRAPGWGKRAAAEESDCQMLKGELDVYLNKAFEAESRLQSFCGSDMDMEATIRK